MSLIQSDSFPRLDSQASMIVILAPTSPHTLDEWTKEIEMPSSMVAERGVHPLCRAML